MEHHAEVLRGGVWRPRAPNWADAAAMVLVLGVFALVGLGGDLAPAPLVIGRQPSISLSPGVLPLYALRPGRGACRQAGPKSEASRTPLQGAIGSGGRQRKSPTGGVA